MKVVILAGGMGTRLKEETEFKPKPLVTIGGKPILWHIMKIYSKFGYNDFIIALGYKGWMIKKKLNFDYLILLDDTHIAYPIPLPMVIWRTFMIQIMLIEILSFNNLKAMAKGKALTF